MTKMKTGDLLTDAAMDAQRYSPAAAWGRPYMVMDRGGRFIPYENHTAAIKELEAKLAKVLTCLRVIASSDNIDGQFARATLARIEKDTP